MVELKELSSSHSSSHHSLPPQHSLVANKALHTSQNAHPSKNSHPSENSHTSKNSPCTQAFNPRPTPAHQHCAKSFPQVFPPMRKFLKRYQLHEKIGSGSYGTVWRCTDKDTGRQAACKQMDKRGDMDSILAEVECLARVQGNPHVLKLEGVYEGELYVFIVTELCDGGDLFDHLMENGEMSECEAKVLFAQIADAVRHCHARGVIHRDVKPENVLLHTSHATGRRIAKLADFGLAKRLKDGEKAVGWVGNEPYEAPEVLSSKPYDFSADIFSLGVVLFGILSANWPTFTNGRLFDPKKNFFWAGWRSVSREAKDLMRRMMAHDPRLRPTATQILEDPWLSARNKCQDGASVDAGTLADLVEDWNILESRSSRAEAGVGSHLEANSFGRDATNTKSIRCTSRGRCTSSTPSALLQVCSASDVARLSDCPMATAQAPCSQEPHLHLPRLRIDAELAEVAYRSPMLGDDQGCEVLSLDWNQKTSHCPSHTEGDYNEALRIDEGCGPDCMSTPGSSALPSRSSSGINISWTGSAALC